ncbi:enoyl-CoA hydratase [Halalkalibacterium halodurans]|uniref:Enoyl-CoA hydratase n=1 Tax=Halalkalibacterium halodurans (strain ATCC BAA-125 / DSM 18197 / FERM 7344 / JCM 9153 / C-125) TaxID=272558 RepID=Q9KDS6_HALH5|nr:enoyl-CoA hydratase [Halalkalibacterium halodurans]MDY7221667.1 enoyl-CoA hydratase [Halalkalibacterium halodurans]MDY7240943.1 enoyl-CoA hydratase [Halalkalibacterium halodurans]MED4079338.1 enoyl-CoA hydratase [Halalkalibacterium halodurans]MED4085409.1 enoyl-CoA hydratase [Halalkalibacterium halodurans]MED4104467.1 enoyl-CoA hydratase [Halalkalibacterium halodurans]
MSETVGVEMLSSGVCKVTLIRPEAANALSVQLLEKLKDTLEALAFQKEVRAVVFTGAGDKVFCAGADLKERRRMEEEEVRRTVALIGETIEKVAKLPQPTIAAMNGTALGGGLELALACDLRVAAEESVYGLPETTLAIIPGAGGTQRLPRLIGVGRAKEMIFTGKRITGAEAYLIGLAQYACPLAKVETLALDLAKQMSANGPIALAQAKKAIDNGIETDLATGLELEKLAYERTISTKDRLEGLEAFKEKRKPQYIGE